MIAGIGADEVAGLPLKKSLAYRRGPGDFLQQPEVLFREPALRKKDAVDVPDRRVVGVVDCGHKIESSADGLLELADRTPGNVQQIEVFAAVLALGVRAYHKLEEDSAAAGIPHLSVKFLFVCLSNIRKDITANFFVFFAGSVGEIPKMGFDLCLFRVYLSVTIAIFFVYLSVCVPPGVEGL